MHIWNDFHLKYLTGQKKDAIIRNEGLELMRLYLSEIKLPSVRLEGENTESQLLPYKPLGDDEMIRFKEKSELFKKIQTIKLWGLER